MENNYLEMEIFTIITDKYPHLDKQILFKLCSIVINCLPKSNDKQFYINFLESSIINLNNQN